MNNVTFTQNQKEQLRQKMLEIEHYIEVNIVPHITSDVYIEFGDDYIDRQTGACTSMYTLCVSPEKKTRYVGWNEYKEAHVGLERGFGHAFILEARLPIDQYELLRAWPVVVHKLANAVDAQLAMDGLIRNFKI